jgi:2-hydroxy-6-oxonona-2,4-dienedioate hydrolase
VKVVAALRTVIGRNLMVSRAVAVDAPNERIERYRRAERTLWNFYGLEPVERFVQLDSPAVRLRVQEVGSGEPVIFVHGGLYPGAVAASLFRELPGYRCIAVDRPGCGLSSAIDWRRRDYGRVATDVMGGLVDALGLERTHVMGHSIGAVWALRLAAEHASRVGRIGILGASPVLPEMRPPSFLRTLASPIGAIITRLPQPKGMVRSILRQDGHGPSLDAGLIPDQLIDWHIALTRDTNTLRNERAMIRDAVIGRGGWRPGLTLEAPELAAIEHPTLYVIGTADPEGSVDFAQHVVTQLPNAQLQIIGRGHVPWFDDAPAVGNAFCEFLSARTSAQLEGLNSPNREVS